MEKTTKAKKNTTTSTHGVYPEPTEGPASKAKKLQSTSKSTLETKLYSIDGASKATIKLPESIFAVKWNEKLVHQVLVGMESNARANTAHTKDRSEVRGGGRKPWRQKGTGSARHGSRRSPIWVGGGVTFGSRNERNYDKKINKKTRNQALLCGLSQKLRDGQIIFADSIAMDSPNTKKANDILLSLGKIPGFETLNTKKANNILIVLSGEGLKDTKKSFRNILQISITEARNLNIVDLAKYRYIIIFDSQKALEIFKSKLKDTSAPSAKVDKKDRVNHVECGARETK